MPFVGYVSPVAVYGGTQELSAGPLGLGDPCDRVILRRGTGCQQLGLYLAVAQRSTQDSPAGAMASGACAMDRCNCSNQRLVPEEGEVQYNAARELHLWLDMNTPTDSLQRHLEVSCWGGGLRGPVC